jgi:TPR repeat protein
VRETAVSCARFGPVYKGFERMNRGAAAVVDRAEQIKWWNAIDALGYARNAEEGMQMARECRHPDAQWLAALFPPGADLRYGAVRRMLQEHPDDPRALFFLGDTFQSLRRAAEMGYAPAQAALSNQLQEEHADGAFRLARLAAAQRCRCGFFSLAGCYLRGEGCLENRPMALELYKLAADLGHAEAPRWFGELAFGEFDWRRYHWWVRGASRGFGEFVDKMWLAFEELLPSFRRGELGHALHELALLIGIGWNAEENDVHSQRL